MYTVDTCMCMAKIYKNRKDLMVSKEFNYNAYNACKIKSYKIQKWLL